MLSFWRFCSTATTVSLGTRCCARVATPELPAAHLVCQSLVRGQVQREEVRDEGGVEEGCLRLQRLGDQRGASIGALATPVNSSTASCAG